MFDGNFHTYFLAFLLGSYFFISALAMLARPEYYRKLVGGLKEESPGLMIGASYGLIIGLAIIVVHNYWAMDPAVVVTVIGWLIFVKSLLWLFFPEMMISSFKRIYGGSTYYYMASLVALIGLFLLIDVGHTFGGF